MNASEVIQSIRTDIELKIKLHKQWAEFHRAYGESTAFDDVKIIELREILSRLDEIENETEEPNELVEAANEYAGDSISDEGLLESTAFIAGAKWQKDKMPKKAIDWIRWNNENGGCKFDGWENSFKKHLEENEYD